MRLAFVDIETTGLGNEDSITEIAYVVRDGGRVLLRHQELCDPGVPIPQRVTDITGITDDMVAGGRSPREAALDFLSAADGAMVVGHNVKFDIGFIGRAAGADVSCVRSIDTLTLSRRHLKSMRSHKLGLVFEQARLCGFGKGLDGAAHRAMHDVEMTMAVLDFLDAGFDVMKRVRR